MLYTKQKKFHYILPVGFMFIVASILLLPKPARADLPSEVAKNIFFGQSADQCASADKLTHVEKRDGKEYYCLKRGLTSTYKTAPAGSNQDCSDQKANGYPIRRALDTGFGKVCIFMKEGSIAYEDSPTPSTNPKNPPSGGQSTGGETPTDGASPPNPKDPGSAEQEQSGSSTLEGFNQGDCPEGYIELSVALQDGTRCVKESDNNTPIEENSIIVYMRNIIRFLSAGVGLVIILMITVSGIQYITSQGDPQGTASAKNRLTNSIIALFLFIFMFAILNYLIPGGVIG